MRAHAPAQVHPEVRVQSQLSQGVVDHPRVVPLLHLEIPANVPLMVYVKTPDLTAGAAALNAGGAPVVVSGLPSKSRLHLLSREKVGEVERVKFAIPAEGVTGHVDMKLKEGVYSAVDAQVAER